MFLKYIICFLCLIQFANANCEMKEDKNLNLNSYLNLNSSALLQNENIPLTSQIDSKNSKEERRGCCSWHQGVCGCSNGRAVCCDGSYSPSCGCD